jgi:hypothetical protein
LETSINGMAARILARSIIVKMPGLKNNIMLVSIMKPSRIRF